MRYRIHFHSCAVTMVVLEAIYKLAFIYILHAYNSTQCTHLKQKKTLSYQAAMKSRVEKIQYQFTFARSIGDDS